MEQTTQPQVDQIVAVIKNFGKENIEEILHKLIEGTQLIIGSGRCRIYLSDLTVGSLTCFASSGSEFKKVRQTGFPITRGDLFIPQVYQQKHEIAIDDLLEHPDDQPATFSEYTIRATYMLPIIHLGHAIGVLCLDRAKPGEFPPEENSAKSGQCWPRQPLIWIVPESITSN